MADRVLAWNTTGSGDWILVHPDLPVDDVDWSTSLQSPTSITVSVNSERDLPTLTPWLTAIGVEVGGELRALGIVTDRDSDDAQLTINCMGLTGYPNGMPWTDTEVRRYDTDPGELIKMIWNVLQSHRFGNLGVQVDQVTTDVRVGVKTDEVLDGEGLVVESAIDEPFLLDRTESHDLGSVIDGLMSEARLEWRELVSFASGKPSVRLEIGDRLGKRRHDLRCEIGATVIEIPSVSEEPTDYASDVLLIGAGEGASRIVSQKWVPEATRVRRIHVYQAQDIDRQEAANAEAEWMLARMQPNQGKITSLVLLDHESCPIWTIAPGDELFITGDLGQAGIANRWVRVISISQNLTTLHQRSLEVVDV